MMKNLLCALFLCFAGMHNQTFRANAAQPQEAQALPGAPIDTSQQQAGAGLKDRISGADLVVAGRVRSIRPGPRDPFVSEHDAEWQDAIVDVQSCIQGAAHPKTVAMKTVVVRFPASMDVAWVRSPKLKKGEEHIFVLKRDEVSGAPTTTVDGASQPVYTALDPQDVLSENDLDRVLAAAKPPSHDAAEAQGASPASHDPIQMKGDPAALKQCVTSIFQEKAWSPLPAELPDRLSFWRQVDLQELRRIALTEILGGKVQWTEGRVEATLALNSQNKGTTELRLFVNILGRGNASFPVMRPSDWWPLASTGRLEDDLLARIEAGCAGKERTPAAGAAGVRKP